MQSTAEYSRRLLKIWILGFVGLAFIVGSVNWVRYFKLVRHGVPIQVKVVELEPDAHPLIRYSYVVDGVSYEGTYEGKGKEGLGDLSFDKIHVGEQLKGYYDQENPSVSCLGNPVPQFERETVLVLLIAIVLPSLVVLRASVRYKKWLKEQKGDET